jgi:hypothetical protein
MRSVIAVLAIVTLSATTFVQAQSLGEVADREKERRKGQKDDGKVITEVELVGAKGTVSMTDGPSSAPATAPVAKEGAADEKAAAAAPGKDAPKEKTEDEIKAEKAAEWRGRVAKANADLEVARKQVTDLEATPNFYMNAAVQAQAAAARQSVANIEQGLATLEEEGRQASYR